jgi:hypothetical protein
MCHPEAAHETHKDTPDNFLVTVAMNHKRT